MHRILLTSAGIGVGAGVLAGSLMLGGQTAAAEPVSFEGSRVALTEWAPVIFDTTPCDLPGAVGCFDPANPGVVTVNPFTNEVGHVIAHEQAHYNQYLAGLPLDECEADRTATDISGVAGYYYATGQC